MITVVKGGPKFEKLAEIQMPDEIAASPAILPTAFTSRWRAGTRFTVGRIRLTLISSA